jgi:hypothetical protein
VRSTGTVRCGRSPESFGKIMKALSVVFALLLVGCRESENRKTQPPAEFLQSSLAGRWLGDSQLPDRHVLSETVIDRDGRYVQHLTNVLSDGVRIATLAGTLHIEDGLLVDTITNDIGGNMTVPRIASIMKLVRVDEHELVLSDTNSSKMISYKRTDR